MSYKLMNYKELFSIRSRIIGIHFSAQGIGICVVKRSKKKCELLYLSFIPQVHLIERWGAHIRLHVEEQTLKLLKEVLDRYRTRRSVTSVSIPARCAFHRACVNDRQAFSYLMDTESPWPLKDSVYQIIQQGEEHYVWALPHSFLRVLDTLFQHRLAHTYQRIDIDLLAWIRFLIHPEHRVIKNYLHPWVLERWPLYWYAPAIGTVLNALS
jgi:hypothetical protein